MSLEEGIAIAKEIGEKGVGDRSEGTSALGDGRVLRRESAGYRGDRTGLAGEVFACARQSTGSPANSGGGLRCGRAHSKSSSGFSTASKDCAHLARGSATLLYVQFWQAEISRRLDRAYRRGYRGALPCLVHAANVRSVEERNRQREHSILRFFYRDFFFAARTFAHRFF